MSEFAIGLKLGEIEFCLVSNHPQRISGISESARIVNSRDRRSPLALMGKTEINSLCTYDRSGRTSAVTIAPKGTLIDILA
jgi:hypothetical protein